MKSHLCCLGILFLSTCFLHSQRSIRYIYFEKVNIFDTARSDWFFGARTINALHALTRDYIIEDELLFREGDELNDDLLDETERNLRRTRLFTSVSIRTENVGSDSVDVIVRTQDKWSTMGEVLYGTGGGETSYGVALREENLAGTGVLLGGQAVYRTENRIGWQGLVNLWSRRVLRSDFILNTSVFANRLRTVQQLSIEKPFLTLNTSTAYGLNLMNSYGDDFLYAGRQQPSLLPYHVRRATALFARSAGSRDRYFWSLLLSVEDVHRLTGQYRQAFDNCGRVLFSLGSLRQDFIHNSMVDGYELKDVAVGAWGQAVLGYMFPLRGGERLYYVGARAEQSTQFMNTKAYVFGAVEASSAFNRSDARYTSLETQAVAHYRWTNQLLITARFRQQTVWNWSAFHQLVLDTDAGLRGYRLNQIAGDNRFISNVELRYHPNIDIWIFRLGATAFYDGGAAWNQFENIVNTRFHHAAGIGLRIFNLKTSGSAAIFRLDFAYNFDERRFAGIVFSSDQLFSAFGNHSYKAPFLGGSLIDTE